MKAIVTLIGVVVVIMMLGAMMLALNAFRGTEISAPYNVTTDGSTEEATVVLANDVLDDNLIHIAVTSSDGDDAPVPFTYVESTKSLTITGLAISTTRTLTVVYQAVAQDGIVDLLAKYFPVFLILGIIAVVAGIIYSAVEHARNR
jgi:hypothetical protein